MAGYADKEGAAPVQSHKVAAEDTMLSGVGWLHVVDGICIHNSYKPVFYLAP